MQNAPIMI